MTGAVPYASGLAARAQGFPLSANPHCFGSAAHARWAATWHKENERLATESAVRHLIANGWEKVPLTEVREIDDLCQAERRVFNGCTAAELETRYGRDNVRHVYGVGWFKRSRETKLCSTAAACFTDPAVTAVTVGGQRFER